MPVLWQASQRPMYVRTVWVGEFRHAILTHDDPYLLKLQAKRHRPNSSVSILTKTHASRLSQRSDDLQDCLRNLNLVITSGKSNIRRRHKSAHEDVEELDLNGVDDDSDDDLVVKASPQPLNENTDNYNSLSLNMKNLRANKTARAEGTELSERVLQWLDLAGKIDLLAPNSTERMTQPRHSWPELQKRNHNLSKSRTTMDVRKEGGRQSAKGGDTPKAQQTGAIDRHDIYVATSANTIEDYARQSRNVGITPRCDTAAKIKDNLKTKCKDLKTNVMETRQKVMTERSAVEKQYAELLSKKLIPDVSRNPKKQVHIFMPEMPKKPDSSIASRAESLLSQISYKSALK